MIPSLRIASLPASNEVRRRSTRQSRISNAGPEAKAEAKNRGARMAVSHSERPGRPLYKKAVTV